MNTSNYFEIEVPSEAGLLYQGSFDSLELPRKEPQRVPVDAEHAFGIVVRRTWADVPWRILLGNEPLADLPAGVFEAVVEQERLLYYEFGESEIVVEQETPGGRHFEVLFQLPLEVVPRQTVVRDYRVMLEDVAQIHQGLAHDVVGRSRHHADDSGAAGRLHPQSMLTRIGEIYKRLARALAPIAHQPSRVLDREVQYRRYRGGDRIDSSTLRSLARDPSARVSGGRVQYAGRMQLRAVRLTDDLPEHRHIAQTIRDLAHRSLVVGNYCEHSAELLREEEARWGHSKGDQALSVYAQRDLPRVRTLEQIAAEAPRTAQRFRDLLAAYPFLASAGPPRSRFGPTPVFLGRSDYREVYEALREAKNQMGLLVDGHAVQISYRNLATLYEYWCFLQVIRHLRQRSGATLASGGFELIDDIYRPELKPGQEFHFELERGITVVASYTPEFYPQRTAIKRDDRFAAAFTRDPLRPDICVEVRIPGRRSAMLVLDAKSTENFHVSRFREISDYGRQIYERRLYYQPVRQVFLLHRDRQFPAKANIPGYFSARRQIDPETMLLGAIPCVPEHVDADSRHLADVINRFLDLYAHRRRSLR